MKKINRFLLDECTPSHVQLFMNAIMDPLCILEIIRKNKTIIDFICQFMNTQGLALVGMKQSEMCGRSIREFHSSNHFLMHALMSAAETGEMQKLKTTCCLRDGLEHDLQFQISVSERFLVVCWQDITERKKLERELRIYQEKFSTLFHSIPCPIALKRISDGRFVEVNQAFEDINEIPKDECLGLTSRDMGWDDPENPVVRMSEDQTLRLDGVKNLKLRKIRKKTGKEFIGLFSSSVVKMQDEEYILSLALDITGQKKAEEDFRLSEERFRKVFQSSPVMMSIQSIQTNCFIDVNKQWVSITGFAREEVIGKTPENLTLMPGMGWSEMITEEKKGLINKEVSFLRKKTGEIIEVLTSLEMIEFQGEDCLLFTGIDVTEKNRYEKELARLDRLNIIGQMAGGIGHEVRNPMTTVRGFLQLLKQKEKFKEEIEFIDLMIEELDQANEIITDFISLSKGTSSPQTRQDLNSIISHLFPILQAQAYEMGKRISLELEDLPQICLNKKEIKQLILNLVQNALEASPDSGVVKVKTIYQGLHVILVIEDKGSGFPKEFLPKLGTPFLTTKEEGPGLGLAVSYSIVERHHGKVKVESSETGTSISVTFPLLIEGTPDGFEFEHNAECG